MARLTRFIGGALLIALMTACGNKPLQLQLPDDHSQDINRTITEGQ